MENKKVQATIEYLTIYSWAIIILALFAAVIYLLAFQTTSTPTNSYCFIQPGLNCYELVVMSSSPVPKAILIFSNTEGIGIRMPKNAFTYVNPYTNATYKGNCNPANAVPGATIVCNATLSSAESQPIGTQINPKFSLSYQLCPTSCNNFNYNTSGTASVFTSPTSQIALVTLRTNPNTGKVSVGGIQYSNGTVLAFLLNSTYTMYAYPPSGYVFSSWTSSAGVSLSGTSKQTITARANSTQNGTVQANFVVQAITTSTTIISSPTTSKSTTIIGFPTTSISTTIIGFPTTSISTTIIGFPTTSPTVPTVPTTSTTSTTTSSTTSICKITLSGCGKKFGQCIPDGCTVVCSGSDRCPDPQVHRDISCNGGTFYSCPIQQNTTTIGGGGTTTTIIGGPSCSCVLDGPTCAGSGGANCGNNGCGGTFPVYCCTPTC